VRAQQGWFDYAGTFLLFHLPGLVLLYPRLRRKTGRR
jgi:hypothetical protein